jgi:MoaA/NifB/PqqE/SkfB family radical SAM enzyme
LQSRGLKAVILTGGGEPTSYKYFNELVQWIKYERGLSVALITNGTLVKRLEVKTLKAFSWIRVSVNLFDQWESRIGNNFNVSDLNSDCIVGCSMVYTVEHESTEEMLTDRVELLKKVSKIADRVNAQYIRLLPNCLLEQKHLIAQHKSLDKTLEKVEDSRFFHQYKVHGAPSSHVCHQAYFRPYLSEEPYKKTGVAGTVYPCDSVVLNDSYQHFAEEYQLCGPGEILDFLDKKISPKFDPQERCKGCVFTENVNMLDDWVNNRVDDFQSYPTPIKHEEFV